MSALHSLRPQIAQNLGLFASDVQKIYREKIHSFYLVGSALTSDYNEKNSDINTVLILKEILLSDIEALWDLGKKHRKKGIAAPVCMTPQYISESIDVFPIEFHDFKLIHLCLTGEDMLATLDIDKEHLRLQCEREMKTTLIKLRQGYLTSLGEEKQIFTLLINSIKDTAPLFRAILNLLNLPIPLNKADVFRSIQDYMDYKGDLFEKILSLKDGSVKFSKQDLRSLLYEYYKSIERLGSILNKL